MPFYTFQDFQISDRAVIRVNVANGNMFFAATDVSIAGAGQALQLDRYYNSFDGSGTTSGSFALGWGSSLAPFDVGINVNGTTAYISIPGGASAVFVKNGSTWAAPEGINATLTEDAASSLARYVLTYNRTGERLSFDTSGYLRAHTDRNGVGMKIDANGTLQAATHTASGRNLQFTYGVGNLIDKATDSSGRTLNYGHTDNGYLASSPDGMTYGYQGFGLLDTLTLDDVSYLIGYDNSKRATVVTVRKSGEPDRRTQFTYNSGTTVVTDPEGRAATYTYDGVGRVTSAKDGLGRTRSQQWTANSDVSQSTDAIGTGTTTYTYDTSGNRTGTKLPTGAAASAQYATGVNCSAPNTGTSFQPKCSTDDAGNKKQYQYDAAGNVTKQSDTTTSTAVTEFERTYGTCGAAAGQVCTTKDGNGNVTSYSYNAKGDLTKVSPPAPQGATSYTYDSAGRVLTVTDGNLHVTKYQYDFFDRTLTSTFNDQSTLRSVYNLDGTERSRTDSTGGVVSFQYNAQNRIIKQNGPTGNDTQTYTYDRVGNLLTMVSVGTTKYTYDAANQLVKLQQPGGTCPSSGAPGANSGCVTFEYDQNALETKRTTPGGATTITTRDLSGRPTRISAKNGAGATVVDIGYAYTPTGSTGDRKNVQSRTAYAEQGIAAGAVTSYTYDSRNRLTFANEKSGNATSASWAYSYDNNANRTKQIRAGNTGSTAGTINYTYDAANRLTSATGQITGWSYDGAGNLRNNGMTGVETEYGVRGDVNWTTNAGDIVNFGLGNTDRTHVGGKTFWSGPLGLRHVTTGDSGIQSFTRTPDGTAIGFEDVTTAGGKFYYIQDHLGSVVGITSGTGAYYGGYSYSPYGENRATGSTSSATATAVNANPLRYISGYHDGNGIYKLGARYYDASLGRFTQMDPSGQEANPYAYAGCNPINGSDPSGLNCTGEVIFGILSAAGTIYAYGTLIAAGIAATPVTLGAGALAALFAALGAAGTIYSLGAIVEECGG